jgi:F0F1-type ATP synthase membrane subunit b/b'
MVLLFPVIPFLLAFIDKTVKWKNVWKNLFYFGCIGLFDFFIAFKIAKTIGRIEYISGKIPHEPSLGEIVLSDDFVSVFILGALVLTLFKFVSKKLMSIADERNLGVHLKKKQKENEQKQEQIESNEEQIRKEQGDILDIQNKYAQMELEMDHLQKELDLIPSKEERIKADFHRHLNVQIAYLENTLQRYMGNIENNRLPITLNAMLDRTGVYLKGWNEFLHQVYSETKAKYMYQEAVTEVNEWTNSKFTY